MTILVIKVSFEARYPLSLYADLLMRRCKRFCSWVRSNYRIWILVTVVAVGQLDRPPYYTVEVHRQYLSCSFQCAYEPLRTFPSASSAQQPACSSIGPRSRFGQLVLLFSPSSYCDEPRVLKQDSAKEFPRPDFGKFPDFKRI